MSVTMDSASAGAAFEMAPLTLARATGDGREEEEEDEEVGGENDSGIGCSDARSDIRSAGEPTPPTTQPTTPTSFVDDDNNDDDENDDDDRDDESDAVLTPLMAPRTHGSADDGYDVDGMSETDRTFHDEDTMGEEKEEEKTPRDSTSSLEVGGRQPEAEEEEEPWR